MRKTTLAILLTGLLLGYGSAALARGPGGGHAGGNAPGKMSDEGRANTNAQWLPGADKGQERAEERRSVQGEEHAQAKEGPRDGSIQHDRTQTRILKNNVAR